MATNGSDSASGDENNPFLTIAHARDVIRASSNRTVCTIHVNIKGGTYRLSEPLGLTSQDSGAAEAEVFYQAASGESPAISGAQQISGRELHDAVLNIWKAPASVTTNTMPRQLYVNGVRATRARTPDCPNYYFPTATGYTYLYILESDPQIPPVWSNPTYWIRSGRDMKRA